MSYPLELGVATRAVAKACELCRQVQANLVTEETVAKKDKSPVTVADFGVQALVTAELTREFPDIPMVGEEDAAYLRSEEGADLRNKVVEHVTKYDNTLTPETTLAAIDYGTRPGGPTGKFWVLDPIDGTKGFLRGDQYAIALGLIVDGQVVLGVLGCPNLPINADDPTGPKGALFTAAIDSTTTMISLANGSTSTVSVTDIADCSKATFCESVEKAHTQQSDSAKIADLLGVTAPPFRIDSQCKYAAIARGDSSIYLRMPTRKDYEERIWDHAAGWIVVTQAGGTVTDINGKPLDFSLGQTLKENSGVVATNGKLHSQVIHAIAQALA